MSYFLFSLPLNPLKGTWFIDNWLRHSQLKPLQGLGVKKCHNKYFNLHIYLLHT